MMFPQKGKSLCDSFGNKAPKKPYLRPVNLSLASVIVISLLLASQFVLLLAFLKYLSIINFPCCDFNNFTQRDKLQIEKDIEEDFKKAYHGILRLPIKSKFGVYVAYKYYYSLFRKIKSTQPHHILQRRIRIANHYKLCIIFRASLKNGLGLIQTSTNL